MMAHHFKMHMQEVHQKFYSTIRNLEEIEVSYYYYILFIIKKLRNWIYPFTLGFQLLLNLTVCIKLFLI